MSSMMWYGAQHTQKVAVTAAVILKGRLHYVSQTTHMLSSVKAAED